MPRTKAVKEEIKPYTKKICECCGKNLSIKQNYYKSYSILNKHSGLMNICKSCVSEIYEKDLLESQDITQAVYNTCRLLDVLFDENVMESSQTKSKYAKEIYKEYMRQCNSLPQYKGKVFSDSNCFKDSFGIQKSYEDLKAEETDEINELKLKWGDDFSSTELKMLEKTYNELKSDKSMKYKSSGQYLTLATISFVKARIAMQKGDVSASKDYMKNYNDAMKLGEFTPSALAMNTTADKLGSFSELSLMVEECSDIADVYHILPSFMQLPKDNVDITVWFLQNYLEKTAGKPLSKYKDIYSFYQKWVNDAEAGNIKNIDELIKDEGFDLEKIEKMYSI